MLGWWSRATASASIRNRAEVARAGVAAAADHLQGDQAVQAALPGLVDDAHAAPAELAEDLVAGQFRQRDYGRRNVVIARLPGRSGGGERGDRSERKLGGDSRSFSR